MNIGECGACRAIADKIKEIRNGNRLMVSDDVNVTMTFYKREQPETKCGVVKINGALDFSLFDAALVILAASAVWSVFRTVRSLFR